ncbi:MAG: Amuc_1100 family pilus-like protein [Kiritimatiellae bacterium]|nr:Amuc_1100 family pilus-like protein [Kiritimatiellia bacterium]
MKSPKHTALIASASLAILLVLISAFAATRAAVRAASVQANLQQTQTQLQAIENRKPFPNAGNIEKLKLEQVRLEASFTNLYMEIARRQSKPVEIEAARFNPYMANVFNGLREKAVANNVTLPDRFLFGFDRYASSRPQPEHIERLIRQIEWVNKVSSVLFDAKVRDLVSIERDVFEERQQNAPATGAPDPGGFSLRNQMMGGGESSSTDLLKAADGYEEDADKLYTRERMIFTFNAREAAVWRVLNELPKMPFFNVVAAVETINESGRPKRYNAESDPNAAAAGGYSGGLMGIEGPRSGVMGAPAAMGMPVQDPGAGGTNTTARMLTTDQRVVAGRTDVIRVRLALDFYHFNLPSMAEPKEPES